MSPHAISNLRVIDSSDNDTDSVDEEVELDKSEDECSVDNDDINNLNFNVLIPEKELFKFIRNSFVCKECQDPIRDRNMHVDRVGCACNLFWRCGKNGCLASGKSLSRVSTVETSGKFKRKHP